VASAGHMQTISTSLQTDNHASPHQSIFYRSNALPDAQPTMSKQWRQLTTTKMKILIADSSIWWRFSCYGACSKCIQCDLLQSMCNCMGHLSSLEMPSIRQADTTSYKLYAVTSQTRHGASTSNRWHFAFGALLSYQWNPCTDCKSTQ